MADITKCEGINCNQTNSCYRYLAKANPYRQSYFEKTPVLKDGDCQMFWDIREIKSHPKG